MPPFADPNETMHIEKIFVGMPKDVEYNGKKISTGIFKTQVTGPVMLTQLKLEGDGQADLKVHGGIDKALYAYPADAYPAWQNLRPDHSFPLGCMGENLSFNSLPEAEMFVGSRYRLGEAVVQVSQPRAPCYKLGLVFNDQSILKTFLKLERPGVYFKVHQEGKLSEGDSLELIEEPKMKVSVFELFRIQAGQAPSDTRRSEILSLHELPASWRAKLSR